MRGLEGARLLEAWERGADRSHTDRARALLEAGEWPAPHAPAGLGERDAWLLELRRRTFGDSVRALVSCPACGQQLEIPTNVDDLIFERPGEPVRGNRDVSVTCGGLTVRARTCDDADLEAASACADPAEARRVLISRCVVEVTDAEGGRLDPGDLDDHVLAAVGDAVAEADPQAEVRLQLRCAFCAHGWEALFDVAQFTWREVAAAAARIVDDVHALASAYGWRERDVLELSPRRRRTYVERASGG